MRELPVPPRPIVITGKLLALYHDGQPVLFAMEGVLFLPLFTREADLRQHLRALGIQGYTIKQVTDGHQFLEDLRGQVRVMLDPWINDKGRVRFTDIRWEDSPCSGSDRPPGP